MNVIHLNREGKIGMYDTDLKTDESRVDLAAF